MSIVTLSNGTYGLILEYAITKKMKYNSEAHITPVISTGKIYTLIQALKQAIKHQLREFLSF